MSAARPEAEPKYSRGPEGPEGAGADLAGGRGGASGRIAIAVLAGGLVGAALLLAAEFTPLLSVHTSTSAAAIKTVATGSHDSYALIPVALLAGLLAYAAWRTGSRLALWAIGVVGLLALLVALIGDLPDAQASGFIGSPTTSLTSASATPRVGFYLESLGAVVLLITAAGGLLLRSDADRSAS